MLHVLYSNRFEELVAALADDLAQARRGGAIDPLAALDVVVPSQMVAAYARREVARRNGIAANLRFPFLERFLADRCQTGRPWRVLDRRLLQVLVLALLTDEDTSWHRDLAPVRDYVGSGSGPAEVRRVQLAGELADLFLGYAMSRPEMVAGWTDGRGAPPEGLERWQRQLWRSLFGPGGLAARLAGPDARWGLLGELCAALSPEELGDGPVYLLGFSYLERGMWPILERLSRGCELRIYALNPCREFWDDLASATRPRRTSTEEPAALQLWGRPGREQVAGLNRLCGWDFRDRFAGGEGTKALAALQQDILDRAPARSLADRPAARGDRSVQILACPGIRRELEIIGNQIAALLVEDATLRLCDIAVLLAPDEAQRYQAQVGAVFGELGGIPHRLADLPLQSESRLVEALDLLFDLPLGRLTRPELLGLMVHPAVMAGHPEIDRDDWIRWCDELGIVHGGDQRDHRGTYIERDVFNWDQGVRRLALGSFMSSEGEGGVPPALRLNGQVYRPARVAPDERRSAARFALLARSLIADARACRAAEKPLADWARHLDALAASYLVPVTPADERALDRCRDAIRGLADLDVGGTRIGYRTARELAREALAGLRSAGGELPSDAVLVAPLAPMRPLPFGVLFLAGLGAGRFPGRDREAGLDLRAGAPRPGDVSARERDRYTFLEALMSARDRLILSYVARDEETGEELEPSSVVHELRDMIQPYLAAEDAAAVLVRHPLRRYAPGGGRDPIALRQAASAALRRDLVEHCARSGAPVPSAAEMMSELGRPERAGLRARVGLPALPGLQPIERREEPLFLGLAVLRRFLECPLQAWATAVLGLRQEDDEDLVAQRDEPFERDILSSTIALREVFLAHLAAGGEPGGLERRYRERLAFDEQSGQAPTGPFARGDERKAGQVLRAWWDALVQVAGREPAAPVAVGFGWAGESDRAGTLLEPIELTVRGRQVFLTGRTEPYQERLGSLLMVVGDDPSPRYRVRGAIDQAALAACDLLPGDGRHLITILTGAGKAQRYRLPALAPAEARAYLGSLVEELLSRAHDYLLPCEAVLARKGRRENGGLREAIRALVDGGRFFSSRGGPLRIGPELAPPPDADAIVARRFGPWLDRMEALRD